MIHLNAEVKRLRKCYRAWTAQLYVLTNDQNLISSGKDGRGVETSG